MVHLFFQRGKRRRVDDGRKAVQLHVEFPLMLPLLLTDDVSKEAEGRSVFHHVASHVSQEEVLVLDLKAEIGPELFREKDIAVHRPEIEKYQGLEDRLGRGGVYPF